MKILIVSDFPVFRRGLSILLSDKSLDFKIVAEISGEQEIIEKVQMLKPDVVILDIEPNDGEGIEIIRRLRQRFPDLGLIVQTVSDNEDMLINAIEAGASAYLLKTAGLDELAESIRVVAMGESILSPPLISKLVHRFRNDKNDNKQHSNLLTPREIEVLRLAAEGNSNKEIAQKCYVSLTTIKAHFRNILVKLEVKNRTGAVSRANSYGLLRTLPGMDSPGKLN